MKTNLICVLLLSFFLVKMDAFAQKAVIKVACVGNSITYGANIPNRNKNSYPAQLQAYLGSDYEVRNYGISGCTLLSKGDYPYVKTLAFSVSHTYRPYNLLISLGSIEI